MKSLVADGIENHDHDDGVLELHQRSMLIRRASRGREGRDESP